MHIETETAEEAKPLNMRQQKFVDHYVISGNATRSAEAAGYRHPNHQAFRLLLNNSVKGAIQRIRDDMTKDTEDRRAEWVSRLETLGVSAEKDSDRLRAIEQLFKAEGWVAPEKQEIVQFNGAFLADLDLDDEEVGEIQGEIPFENNDMH